MAKKKQKSDETTFADVAVESAAIEAAGKWAPVRVKENLLVMLSEEERAEKGGLLAKTFEEKAESEDEKKAWLDDWKEAHAAIEDRAEALAKLINHGEERSIDTIHTFIPENTAVIVTRADTGEKIRERAMTRAELQPDLFVTNEKTGDVFEAETGLFTEEKGAVPVDAAPVCPCSTSVEDPGPDHIPSCPFNDPDYVGGAEITDPAAMVAGAAPEVSAEA